MNRQFIAVDEQGNEHEIVAASKLVAGSRDTDYQTSDGKPVVEIVPGCTYEIVGPPPIRLRVASN